MKTPLCMMALLCFISIVKPINEVSAQIPPPVDLGISNITQNDPMWCWAAVAQQIIYKINGQAPQQCELVSFAKNGQCCSYSCSVPGNFQDIQNLVLRYGGHFSSIAPPANAGILYQTLSNGNPIILYLQTSPQIGHYIVLRGMAWLNTPMGVQPFVYVNDPMSIYPQSMPFSNVVGVWAAAIVIN
jgi:hypothetical protein